MIDHWDSFTYNIVQLLEQVGAKVKVVEYGKAAFNESRNFHYVILSPGPGVVEEYPMSLQLLNDSEPDQKILGICLGMQMIAYANGSRLFNQDHVKHGQQMDVFLSNDLHESSMLNNISDPFHVGLYHSWAVDESTVKVPLQITARSKEGIVMGLQHLDKKIEGVQFHPESFLCSVGHLMINNWLTK